VRLAAAGLLLLALQSQAPRPPRHFYDHKTDISTYSTGDVRTGERSGLSASFTFPGKVPTRPAVISMGFGVLRVPDQDHPQADKDLLQWQDVTSMEIQYGHHTVSLPAEESHRVSHNTMVEVMYGHAIEEGVGADVTPEQFEAIVAEPEFQVKFGNHTETVKGKPLATLRKLAASIPPKS
jgi:hypothetical protein